MTADEFLPYLPRLRRFARLLMGDQAAGDWLIASVLHLLIAEPARLRTDVPVRTALYALVLELFDKSLTVIRAPPEETTPIQQRLQAMAPTTRRVFLLVTVEEFSLSEAAEILSITPQEIAARLDEAGQEIAGQIKTRVLILEDEPLIAQTLGTILEDMGHTVVGIAATRDEARAIFAREKPGLILADVKLADGSSGIEAARDISAVSDTPVIFVTAFPDELPERAGSPVGFLVAKPFCIEQIKAIVSQTLFFHG